MKSYETLELISQSVVWALIGITWLLLAYRLYWHGVKKRESRQSIFQLEGNWFSKVLKVLMGISMLGYMVTIPFMVYIISAGRTLLLPFQNELLMISALLLAGVEFWLSFSVSEKLVSSTLKKGVLVVLLAPILIMAYSLLVSIPEIYSYPLVEECYVVDLPTEGVWRAGHAGASELINYHCAVAAQKYAMDVVRVGESGKAYRGKGETLEDFYTMGAPIYAPVSGKVVNAIDSLPNTPLWGESKGDHAAGNHVVIEIEKDRYVFLAHLEQETIKVKKGDEVEAGDLIGAAGNSGNSTAPHLHMHIQDLPVVDNKNAQAYPYRFKKMQVKRWLSFNTVLDGFLVRNDLFQEE